MAVETTADRTVRVGVAEFRVGQAPMRMMTLALGSCLGIVLFDGSTGVGALAHAMHPRRERVKSNANRAKFVDSAVPVIIERMTQWGARRERIVAKIFGGACMFDSPSGVPGIMQIGDENIAAAREVLREHDVPIVAECVGGNTGRTIVFNLSDGSVRVRDVSGNEEIY